MKLRTAVRQDSAWRELAFIGTRRIAIGLSCLGLTGCQTVGQPSTEKTTWSSFDKPTADKDFNAGMINFQGADVQNVLAIYQEVSGRTIIRPAALPLPQITVRNQTPLNRV